MKLKTSNRKTSVTRNEVKKAVDKVSGLYHKKVDNKYKVPKKMWDKFKSAGQTVYNDVMDQSLKNQSVTVHPNTFVPANEWATICHNMACYAAWSVSDNKLEKGSVVIDIKRGKETKRQKVV